MKKIIIVSILLLAFLYGENVAGFEFGEVFKDYKKYKEYRNNTKTLFPHEYIIDKDVKFFDKAEIGTDENHVIKAIAFIKIYKMNSYNSKVISRKIVKDYNDILATLEKRYGKFDKKDTQIAGNFFAKELLELSLFSEINETSTNKNPKSNKIGLIKLQLISEENETSDIIMRDNKEITMMLAYLDKE
jgi:hypothetical protein